MRGAPRSGSTNQYVCTIFLAVRQAPRRTQQRSLDTRERLVEAALGIYAARGFEGATTRAIAERAGVALAALPYHFETKDALWRAAADRIFGLLRARFEEVLRGLEGRDLRERLRRLMGEFVRFAARHPELHRFMLQEGAGPSDRLAWLTETHLRPLFGFVCGLIAEAQAQGVVPPGRPEHLYYALIGAASMPYAVAPEYARLTGDDPASEPLVEAHVEALLGLLLPATARRERRAGAPARGRRKARAVRRR
jgi:AcrR family transcriptional regulator